MKADDRLELFFSQSLDGFFFMMLDEPVRWDDSVERDRVLDHVFEHQSITKVNDAIPPSMGRPRAVSRPERRRTCSARSRARRRVWGSSSIAAACTRTDERRVDGTPIRVEGDYLCFYDEEGRITGHFASA